MEYKPNSHRSKEIEEEKKSSLPQKKVEKVVSGAVQRGKNGKLSKFESLFMPGDFDSIKSYILMDVLVPSIKRAISDIICNGINMLLGETVKKSSDGVSARVPYRAYYQDRDNKFESNRPRAAAQYTYDDIIFDDRGDAELVLAQMDDILQHFDSVSVAELFEMTGLSSNYTDNKYGWTDLRGASVRRVRNGYVLDLPRATNL